MRRDFRSVLTSIIMPLYFVILLVVILSSAGQLKYSPSEINFSKGESFWANSPMFFSTSTFSVVR
jgi:hypothetical protein